MSHLQGMERTSSARLASSLGHNYDAVIGSLPKGLSVEERAKLAASLPMSPALGALASLPKVGWGRAWHKAQGELQAAATSFTWADAAGGELLGHRQQAVTVFTMHHVARRYQLAICTCAPQPPGESSCRG